ncbi:ATP-binding protein [Luteolibacter algae]|uniref:histidine kinase n=1 Tax=Luteolibacter algae TaxID=454151 RepID=A0ABW5DA13_9BACT
MPDRISAISSADRLLALKTTGLMDSEREEAFDRLTELASRVLEAPVALVSLVDDSRQFFKSSCGLPGAVEAQRGTPLSHSFCQHVVNTGSALIVENAVEHELVKDNPAVTELGVISYLGFPIRVSGGHVLGSFCVIDTKIRRWSTSEISLVEDLTAIVSSEIELRISRNNSVDTAERLELLLDSAGEGIYGMDVAGNCTFVNSTCVELLGYPDGGELLGKNMHQLIHHSHGDGSEFPEEDCAIFKACCAREVSKVSGEVFWKKDGSSFPVEYSSSPIVREGKLVGAVVLFSDITRRLETENALAKALEDAEKAKRRAERADREKSRFLANMSHEIRTPMNAVIGFTELLGGYIQDAKARRYLDVIRSSGSSLLNLINDILDLSKIESAEIELSPGPCNLRDMASRLQLLFSQKAEDKGLRLNVVVAPDVPKSLNLDGERIRQVMVNLLGNALKFTEGGEVSLSIATLKDEGYPEKTTLIFNVSDTGYGMTEEDLKKIFKPFQQASSAARTSEVGTGLGLSISQSIVQLSGGKISAQSTFGVGSMFSVRIPAVEILKEEEQSIDTPARIDFDDFETSRILIVDDNLLNRELLDGYFAASSHKLFFAHNGERAVELAKEHQPHLILMDIRMPGISGSEAREIIASSPECNQANIIAVTASSMLGQEMKLRKVFHGYLRKPIRPHELYEEIAKFLPQRK